VKSSLHGFLLFGSIDAVGFHFVARRNAGFEITLFDEVRDFRRRPEDSLGILAGDSNFGASGDLRMDGAISNLGERGRSQLYNV
jgi:hypothetical protein